jgi:hypothetical protein
MLRVSPRIYSFDLGDQKDERIMMGNLAVAEELLGSDELDELYKLSASESDPEDDDQEDDEDDEDVEPEDIPHE